MRQKRIYLPEIPSKTGQILVDRQTSHYLATVLRCRSGDKLQVFNGKGGSYSAEIEAINKQAVSLKLLKFTPDEQRTTPHITLAYGISKAAHMDYAVQKAVELGVHHIAPLFTRHGNVRPNKDRLKNREAHWRKIIIRACEQCGRNDLPELSPPKNYQDWLAQKTDAPKYIFSTESPKFLNPATPPPQACILLIGPEGGFSPEEHQQAKNAGYNPITLGPRTLRTETAVTVALTTIQILWGDMRPHPTPQNMESH